MIGARRAVGPLTAVNTNTGRLHLYVKHRRALVDYAAPIVGDRARAEDVVQEAFTRFVSAGPSGLRAKVAQPLAYLYRIVRNLALDGRRIRAREGRHVVETFDATEFVADATPTPETALSLRQEARILEAALDALPERTRVALEMYRMEGAKLRDIAEHLGVSVGLAHALVAEGIAHCRDRLRRAT